MRASDNDERALWCQQLREQIKPHGPKSAKQAGAVTVDESAEAESAPEGVLGWMQNAIPSMKVATEDPPEPMAEPRFPEPPMTRPPMTPLTAAATGTDDSEDAAASEPKDRLSAAERVNEVKVKFASAKDVMTERVVSMASRVSFSGAVRIRFGPKGQVAGEAETEREAEANVPAPAGAGGASLCASMARCFQQPGGPTGKQNELV